MRQMITGISGNYELASSYNPIGLRMGKVDRTRGSNRQDAHVAKRTTAFENPLLRSLSLFFFRLVYRFIYFSRRF